MSTESVKSASEAAKRNLASVRTKYNNTNKNSSQQWDGSGLAFTDTTLINNIFAKLSPVLNNNNNVQSNTTAQNVDPKNTFKEYDRSLSINNHINTNSPSNANYSFLPKISTETATEPPPSTISFITGANFQNILVEIAEVMTKFFANIPAQINLMTKMTNDSSMSLWKLLVGASVAAGQKAHEDMQNNIDSARSAAEKAGNCAGASGIIEMLAAAVACVLSITVAIAAAPLTGGGSIAAAAVLISAVVGAISSAVMIGDGYVKAKAGFTLASQAKSTDDIQALISKFLPLMQFGVFTAFGDKAAKAQEGFNIASAIVAILGAGAEMMAGRAAAQGAAAASGEAAGEAGAAGASKLTSSSTAKAISLTNSGVSITGMIANAADPNCEVGNSDGHTHNMSLWASMSSGLMGAAMYAILETSWGTKKTAAERMQQTGLDCLATGIESASLLLFSLATMYVEYRARVGDVPQLGASAPVIMQKRAAASIAQYVQQTSISSEQETVQILMTFLHATMLRGQGDAQKEMSQVQLLRSLVSSITTQNDQMIQSNIKLTGQFMQTFGAFLTALKQAFTTHGQAIRSNVA